DLRHRDRSVAVVPPRRDGSRAPPRPGAPGFAPSDREDDLAELLAGLEPPVGVGDLREREHAVDDRPRLPGLDQLAHGAEVLRHPHRRAEHRQLLPPDAVQRRRRVRPGRRAAHDHAPFGPRGVERALRGRLADVVDDDVRPAAGRLLHRRDDVVASVVDGDVRPCGAGQLELLVARRRHDHVCPERLGEHQRRGRDAAADAPDEHPLARLETRARREHPVGGLEDERERRRLLEAQSVGDRMHQIARHPDQLRVRAVSRLADDVHAAVVHDARVDDDALVGARDHAGAVGAQDARLRHGGQPLADPDVEVVERGRAQLDEHVAVARLGVGHVLVAQHLRPAVLVDPNSLHGHNPCMPAGALSAAVDGLAFDAVGVARAEAYADAERHILDRRERGLFASMKFTMAIPEVSCHPERLLPGARSVVSAARCYYRPEAPLEPGEGRLARYTWADEYAALRDDLDRLGRRLGGSYRVLVDANQHVDREGAARGGVGFYGKNTMLITRRHGSFVVLGTLVTDVELEPTAPLDADCGACRLCVDACPTGALDEPGTLDATRCLSYWTQAPGAIPESYRPARDGHVDLVAWLEADGRALVAEHDRLYVPRNDARLLRRNALVALGNVGGAEHLGVLDAQAAGGDELLAAHAAWAAGRIRARHRAATSGRDRSGG